MQDVALMTAFAGLAAGVVAVWASIHHSLSSVIVWGFIGSVIGLGLYSLFSISIGRDFAIGWQGYSWMLTGALFALTAFSAWREIKG